MDEMTWDTLLDYMARLTKNMRTYLQKLETQQQQFVAVFGEKEARQALSYQRQQAYASIWLVPLVEEAQRRPVLQSLVPMLSVGIVRLFRGDNEFAHITALDEGVFRLQRVQGHMSDWNPQLISEGTAEDVLDHVEGMLE